MQATQTSHKTLSTRCPNRFCSSLKPLSRSSHHTYPMSNPRGPRHNGVSNRTTLKALHAHTPIPHSNPPQASQTARTAPGWLPSMAEKLTKKTEKFLGSCPQLVPAGHVVQAVAISMLLCGSGPAVAQQQQPAVQSVVGPATVVDGDTLRVQNVKIRMFGVDAPEKSQTCKDAFGRDYNCGQVSLQALTQKLSNQNVRCDEVARDIYGRSVATCFVSQGSKDEDVNQWLVENGYAVAYRQYSKDYIPAEEAAKAAKRGIWQGTFQMPAEYRRQNRQNGGNNTSGPTATATNSTSSIDLEDLMAALFGAPAGCADPQIKGNISASGEKIYHVPGGRSYKAVKIEPEKGEKFFCTPTEAEQAGFRKSQV